MAGTCSKCLFWNPQNDDRQKATVGLCQRMPPHISRSQYEDIYAEWPKTRPKDWCGEFSQDD